MPKDKHKIHPAFFKAEIFDGMSNEDIAQVSSYFKQREFQRDEYLFHEREAARTFYIIMDGQVKILQTSAEGFEVILHVLGEGELIGALPLLAEGTYPAAAQALTHVVAYAIAAEDFSDLLSLYPPMCVNMLRFATRVLQASLTKLREMATERVEQRIARATARLADQIGKATDEGILLDAPISRQDLAEMTGTTVFAVSRILRSWERKHIISLGREQVIVKQKHELMSIANGLSRVHT